MTTVIIDDKTTDAKRVVELLKTQRLLIWNKNESQKTIILIGTGSHSDLF